MCPAGTTDCNRACTSTQVDAQNCGMCGHACPVGEQCTRGVCGCPPGQSRCGGMCVNVLMDPNNCGHCGTVCSLPLTCQIGYCF
jgi:hypothetical protein